MREVRAGEVGRAADQLGQRGPSASIAFCDALRVAIVSRFRVRPPASSSSRAPRQVGGSSPADAAPELRGAPPDALLRTASSFAFHCRFELSRRARARPSRRRRAPGSRTADASSRALSRVAATSSAPSGAPCAAPVLAFFGAPFAITVLQQISVGRVALALRLARSPRRSRSASWPSTSGITCQP